MNNNILIVDDSTIIRMMIRNILIKHGYNIVGEAENGNVAIEKYETLQPDIVTMDITMPDKDGLTALKEIKVMDPHAKIIICSTMGQRSVVDEVLQAGAIDFVSKPFQAERLIEAIQRAQMM